MKHFSIYGLDLVDASYDKVPNNPLKLTGKIQNEFKRKERYIGVMVTGSGYLQSWQRELPIERWERSELERRTI